MKTVLAAFVVIALAACGREEPGRDPAADPGSNSEKSIGRKGGNPESAPTGADPVKDGY